MNETNDVEKPSVDVVIPVYNGEAFIKDAIESIVHQTYLPRQIIVVNDGSTDATEQIIYDYINQINSDVFINYIKKNNGGPNSARNKGVEHCSSEFIAFLDADDIWEKDKLEKQIDVFKYSNFKNLGVVYCDYDIIDVNGKLISNFPCFALNTKVKGNILKYLLNGNMVASSASGVLIKKECFEKVGLFDECLYTSEDWDMWLRIAELYEFDYVNEKLVKLRRHNWNSSNSRSCILIGNIIMLNKWVKYIDINSNIIKSLRKEIIIEILKELPNRRFYYNVNKQLSNELKALLFGDFFDIIKVIIKILTDKIFMIFRKLTNLRLFKNLTLSYRLDKHE
jgi:glycosyltransferase involved in cell wall biosynthesis